MYIAVLWNLPVMVTVLLANEIWPLSMFTVCRIFIFIVKTEVRAVDTTLFLSSSLKVFTSIMSIGYGPSHNRGRWDGLTFDGDEQRYEQWEVKLLAYLRLKKLKKHALGEANYDVNKNEEVFSEMVQFLDDRSLALMMVKSL